MELANLIQIVGVLIVSAATVRAMLGFYAFTSRRVHFARQEKQDVAAYRKFAENVLGKLAADRAADEGSWQGKRKFKIAKRVYENQAGDICSFYLVPYDGGSTPTYRPGQFLTFEFAVPGQDQLVTRCYSLSESPTERGYYRITVKRLAPPPNAPPGTPPGLSSSHFHDRMTEGAIVEAYAPAGEFCVDESSKRPIMLIAGGVGLTPLVSMLNWLVASGSKREIWFVYAVRNRAEHAMYEHLQRLDRDIPNVRVFVAYEHPTPACRKGVDYKIEGRLSAAMLHPVIDSRAPEIYLCGPPPMMNALTEGFTAMGVAADSIRTEAFGSVSRGAAATKQPPPSTEAGETFRVAFARSGKTIEWSHGDGSLLDLAEAHGIKARCGCRQGICGSCTTGLKDGEVGYLHQPERAPMAGKCLPCISHPKSDMVIDL